MGSMGSYKNVFDDKNEYNKLKEFIVGGISQFSEYRKGNLTYGEIMYVMECVLDEFRDDLLFVLETGLGITIAAVVIRPVPICAYRLPFQAFDSGHQVIQYIRQALQT